MEQPIKKTNFLTFPDLALSFVHKRSGDKVTKNVFTVCKAFGQRKLIPLATLNSTGYKFFWRIFRRIFTALKLGVELASC